MYLFGTKLLINKFVILGLQLIFGVGKIISLFVLKKLGFCLNLKVKSLTKFQIYNLVNVLKNLDIFLYLELKKFRFLNFKKLLKIKLVKGYRKKNGLPIRGQRTHTNAKTASKIFYFLDSNKF